MQKKFVWIAALVCLVALATLPASAQEMRQEKPPLYTYVSLWQIPRAQWGDMDKQVAGQRSVLDKLVANGTLVGYGDFAYLIHERDGYSHGDWFQATSLGNIYKALDVLRNSAATMPIYTSSTAHQDFLQVTRMYNGHSGTFTNAYLRVIQVDVKPNMEDDWNETVEKYLVPLYEGLLADGTIHSYQIDSELSHTGPANRRWVVYMASSADALDKISMAANAMFEKNPAIGAALSSVTKMDSRHDSVALVGSMTRK